MSEKNNEARLAQPPEEPTMSESNTIKDVRELARIMVENGLTQVDLHLGQDKIRLRRGQPAELSSAGPMVYHHQQPAPQPAASPAPSPEPELAQAAPSSHQPIKSKLVGTFYAASSPDAEPYVRVGDKVSPDTVVCIIEAMKVFNEMKAGVAGTVKKVLVENGQAVQYDQELFLISPDG
jgi:acetyl-CoA carboxylase biotin carboxyl carrier protein